jgi:hypothetical protein
VTVLYSNEQVPFPSPATARYLVSVLDQLGCRASLRTTGTGGYWGARRGTGAGCQASGEVRISVPDSVSWPVATSTVTWPVPWAPAKIPVLARPSTR